ncbi:hypothetical protein WKI72_14495 [Candidatus Erwinia dacicola]
MMTCVKGLDGDIMVGEVIFFRSSVGRVRQSGVNSLTAFRSGNMSVNH